MHCLNCSRKITYSSIMTRWNFFKIPCKECGVSYRYTGSVSRFILCVLIALVICGAFFLAFGRRIYGDHIIVPTFILCFGVGTFLDWFMYKYASKNSQYAQIVSE